MKKIYLHLKEGVTYSHVQEIGKTILVPMCYKHIAELMEVRHCAFQTFEIVTNTTQAIIAEIDNKIVGFSVFNHLKGDKEILDIFGYVDPNHRRKGIYLEMERCLYVKYTLANKINCIRSYSHTKNEVSTYFCKKVGIDLCISEETPESYEYIWRPTKLNLAKFSL
jgi:RimJ/RimL family protein N-acetyltransferase